jgi:prephenate dehydrogenase
LEVRQLKVAVIGGAGRMGRWLVDYFIKRGYEVTVSDTRYEEAKAVAQSTGAKLARNNIDAVRHVEITVLSTPIEVTPKILLEISSEIQKSAAVVEISSLKSQVFPILEKIASRGVRTLSIHPLFGPGVRKTAEEKIALVPVSDPTSELRLAKTVFPKAELIVVDVEEHDRAMALALSLPHFLNIVFASVTGQEDINVLKKLGGTTFALQLILSEGVMSEDPSLYASIQINNKFTAQILERFLSNAETLKRHITERDSKSFLQFYADARTSLVKDGDFAKSYEKMYKVLEALSDH